MKKMGMWSSPTGEVFLDEVFVPANQLLGEREKEESREGARDVFHGERTGIVPMGFGIIERCLEESIKYAKERETWGKPIGEYQLVQQKLARMYVHYQNTRNLLFKHLWMAKNGVRMTMGEACAMKAYVAPAATECAMEAVQILGGNGYMREFRVEQLARDAKLLQIGGGTDEIQQITCARALLAGDMVLG
jgi:alkylation response protein AidB-like acyl-CoA dehydrogenase